jgi:hypothetical protein
MKDYYKQLGLPETAPKEDLRAALASAGPSIREPGEFILLDPRRREVYDRNRRVLSTIGRLRGNLGLNLTRFWPRARFADFTHELAPPAAHSATDPMSMAWAFGVQPPSARAQRATVRRAVAAAGMATVAATVAFVAWRMTHGGW